MDNVSRILKKVSPLKSRHSLSKATSSEIRYRTLRPRYWFDHGCTQVGCETTGIEHNTFPLSVECLTTTLRLYSPHPPKPPSSTEPTHLSQSRNPTGWTASRPASPSRCWRLCTGTPCAGTGGRSAPPAGAPAPPPGCYLRSWRSTRSCWAGWSRPCSRSTPPPRGWCRTQGQGPGPGPVSRPGCRGRLWTEGGPTRRLRDAWFGNRWGPNSF